MYKRLKKNTLPKRRI